MLISTLNLEAKALKAFRGDSETESDQEEDLNVRANQPHSKAGVQSEIELGNYQSSLSEGNTDGADSGRGSKLQYMGGEKERGGKKRNKKDQGCFERLLRMSESRNSQFGGSGANQDFKTLSEQQKKERMDYLWRKARRYTNKLRFQARLQKMAESNLKEMMIDDINEDANEEVQQVESNQGKLKWYLIDKERTPCKVWDFVVTLIIMYNLFVTPFILVFSDQYQNYDVETETYFSHTSSQKKMKTLELAFDTIYIVEILLNFIKRTRAHKDLSSISDNYIKTYFVFDVVATVPCLLNVKGSENFSLYFLKCFRIVHFFRISKPLQLLLSVLLQKYSKKRQNDLTSFCALILYVIYISHCCACIFIFLGKENDCKGDLQDQTCTKSWIYQEGANFETKNNASIYIFAFYWIFEVITTVGYGDYSGQTQKEYIFSILLEFLGLTFFSFLMGSITSIFSTSDNFDDLIEQKLDSLDMWIKKIEKSNKPFHIQPTLYNDIRKYVEQAFLYDFNLVIEEFNFYQQITPKMQTDLIQNTRVFQEFERSFNHFFDECERGFTNELIINMFCRIFQQNKTVISYKSNVKEMFFIRQGIVQVFNNDNDEEESGKTILYLPKYSYFGDYQILCKLKSNLVFKTLSKEHAKKKSQSIDFIPDILFMCVSKERLLQLCSLFPQTAENIKRKSLERRQRFMQQKNTNSISYRKAKEKKAEAMSDNSASFAIQHAQGGKTPGVMSNDEEDLEAFHTDEEPENSESQKEDMKTYLSKLNKRIDTLVDALKEAEKLISKQTSEKAIREQVQNRDNYIHQAASDKVSIAQFFHEKIKQ